MKLSRVKPNGALNSKSEALRVPKQTPILVSGAMVRAIIDGLKTQTRRVGKMQISGAIYELGVEYSMHATKGLEAVATYRAFPNGGSARWGLCACPYGIPGDRLWVRESFYNDIPEDKNPEHVYYRADGGCCEQIPECQCASVGKTKWIPSIHMPRWASRITLEITDIRVQRLKDISEEDAWAEGCKRGLPTDNGGFFPAEEPDPSGVGHRGWDCAVDWYTDLWESINGEGSWDNNPWVWVISFRVAEILNHS